MTVLQVRNLSKAFFTYRREWHRIAGWLGFKIKPDESHWILQGLSFELSAGEAVGIVGQNGAGKSTLLKIITGTLQPTEGFVEISGQVAAILELGMGFNPELTGRQNSVHAAGLMGLSAAEIETLLPQIEEFAEIGDYFDEPVRTYSSGMQMRVAFAVATAKRPEILIVDEALSVGDAYFQHKSFSRIKAFQKKGTSLLIVSHDRSAIQALCSRAILIEKGAVLKDGAPEEVMDYYNALTAEKENQSIRQFIDDRGQTRTISGNDDVTFENIQLLDSNNQPVECIRVGQEVSLSFRLRFHASVDDLVIGFMIKDRLGQSVFGTNTHHLRHHFSLCPVGSTLSVRLHFDANLGEGSYSVALAAHATESHVAKNYQWQDLALTFKVINTDRATFIGLAWLPTRIEVMP